MILKSTLIGATAIAIALTSFDLRPAAAAPQSGPAVAKQNAGADEISAARRRRDDRGHRGRQRAARLLRAPLLCAALLRRTGLWLLRWRICLRLRAARL